MGVKDTFLICIFERYANCSWCHAIQFHGEFCVLIPEEWVRKIYSVRLYRLKLPNTTKKW